MYITVLSYLFSFVQSKFFRKLLTQLYILPQNSRNCKKYTHCCWPHYTTKVNYNLLLNRFGKTFETFHDNDDNYQRYRNCHLFLLGWFVCLFDKQLRCVSTHTYAAAFVHTKNTRAYTRHIKETLPLTHGRLRTRNFFQNKTTRILIARYYTYHRSHERYPNIWNVIDYCRTLTTQCT